MLEQLETQDVNVCAKICTKSSLPLVDFDEGMASPRGVEPLLLG